LIFCSDFGHCLDQIPFSELDLRACGDYGTVELNSHRVIVACGDLDDAAGEILVFP
jgi:hypothetical protein